MLQLTSTDKLNKREDVKFAWLRESALYAFSHLWLRKGRQKACAPVGWHNHHHLRLPPRSATRYRSWTRTRADWLISIWLRQFSPILRFFFLRRTDFPAKNLCRWVLLITSLWRESLGNHSKRNNVRCSIFISNLLNRKKKKKKKHEAPNQKAQANVVCVPVLESRGADHCCWWFSPRDHKIPLNSRCHFCWLQKWIELDHVSQAANFSLSSHNFGEVAVIHNISKITKRVSYGAAMLDDMPWLESQKLATWPTWPSSIKKSGICYLRRFCGDGRHRKTKNKVLCCGEAGVGRAIHQSYNCIIFDS